MTRWGTAYFVSKAAAVRYYKPYGYSRGDVEFMIRKNEIHIGPPEVKPGERAILIDEGTRYAIEEE